MPQKGVTLIKIANRYVDDDNTDLWEKGPWEDREFTTVMMVSLKDSTCFYIEENKQVFPDVKELIDTVCRGLNRCLESEKLKIVASNQITCCDDDCGIMAACAVLESKVTSLSELVGGVYIPDNHLLDNKYELAYKLITCSLTDVRKHKLVISKLYDLVMAQNSPKTITCILRAAMDAGVIERPSYNDFIAVFHCGHILSKKQFSDYTKPSYKKHLDMILYKNAKQDFLDIKEMKI